MRKTEVSIDNLLQWQVRCEGCAFNRAVTRESKYENLPEKFDWKHRDNKTPLTQASMLSPMPFSNGKWPGLLNDRNKRVMPNYVRHERQSYLTQILNNSTHCNNKNITNENIVIPNLQWEIWMFPLSLDI